MAGTQHKRQDDDSGANPEVLPEGAPLPEGAKSEKPGEVAEKSEADRLLDQLRAETGPEIAEGLLDQLKEETNERKRIELLRSMLTDQDVETLDSNLLALKQNPEVLDETKITALAFLTDELLYVLPQVLIEKPDLDPMNLEAAWMGIYLLKDPSTKKRDPRVVPLTKTLKYLREKRGTVWVKAYLEEVYPKVVEQARVIAPQVAEMVDEVRRVNAGKEDEKGAKTKIREMIETNPILTTTGLVLGAYAGARLIHWMYKKLRERQEKKIAAGEKVRGQGFFGFMDKVAGVFDFIAKPALLASLVAILAGSVLGIDEVKKYLEKTGRGGIYENRAVAALVHFVHGRPDEAIATLMHKPRSANEKVRHQRYAKYFDVEEKHVWVLGPVKFKDFVEADPNRSTSLVSSKFGKLPILGGLFESPEQVAAEKKIRDFFTDADIQQIRANLDGADGKTMNEILQFAFFNLSIFDSTASPAEAEAAKRRADAGESTPREQLAAGLDAEVVAMAEKTKGLDSKDVLLEKDLETLLRLNAKVNDELLELQSTLPSRMTVMKEVIVKTFHSFISEDEVEDVDMVAAKAQYDAVFDEFEKDEKTAISADLDALAEGKKFFDKLDAGKPLTDDDKDQLKQHVAKMNQVYGRIRQAIKDIKKIREDEIALDIAEGPTDTDIIEGAQIWWTGYTQTFFGLGVDLQTLVDEDTGKVSKAWAISGLAAKGLILEEGTRGLMMAFTGRSGALLCGEISGVNRLVGAATFVCPPVRIFKEGAFSLWPAYKGLRYSQAALLDKVFAGKMGVQEAAEWARAAHSYQSKVAEGWRISAGTPVVGSRVAARLSYWGKLVSVFENIAVQDLNLILTDPDAGNFLKFAEKHYAGSYGPIEELRAVVTKRLGIEWPDFVARVRRLNAESGKSIAEHLPTLRSKAAGVLRANCSAFVEYMRKVRLEGRMGARFDLWMGEVRPVLEGFGSSDWEALLTSKNAGNLEAFLAENPGMKQQIEALKVAAQKHLGMNWEESVRFMRNYAYESKAFVFEGGPVYRSFSRFVEMSYRLADKMGMPRLSEAVLQKIHPDFMKFVGQATKTGMSSGLAIVSAYAIMNMMYDDREKAEAVMLTFAGFGASVAAHRTYEVALEVGTAVGVRAPGPAWAKAVVGFVAAAAVAIGGYEIGEHYMDELLKQREGAAGMASSFARGSLAPALHTFSAGALLDMPFWAWSNNVKNHFMTETYFLDSRGYYKAKPAFGFHRDQKSIESAISMWNGKINEQIAEAKADGDKSEVRELEMKLINEDWIDRQIVEYAVKKDRVSDTGGELYDAIVENFPDLTTRQNALCKSILVDDVPDTWIEDEYRTAEDDERFVLVKSLVERIDEQRGTALEDKLGSFVTYKKDLQYDKKFYGVIGMTERVVEADKEEVDKLRISEDMLLAMLGINKEELVNAQAVIDEMEEEPIPLSEEDIELLGSS